jgi:hypothetical protein
MDIKDVEIIGAEENASEGWGGRKARSGQEIVHRVKPPLRNHHAAATCGGDMRR